MHPLDRIGNYMGAHAVRLRRLSAVALTVWLVGWIPTIAFTDNWPGRYGPQLYAWWIILMPLALFCAVAAAIGLWCFYWWALEPAEGESVQERIERLERELGIR